MWLGLLVGQLLDVEKTPLTPLSQFASLPFASSEKCARAVRSARVRVRV